MELTAAEGYASGGPGVELEAPNLGLAFARTVERLGDDAAIIAGEGDSEAVTSWNELARRVGRIAGGLAKLGVRKGDTVALMLNNRPEFIPIDLAAVCIGAVPFSIYQTSSPEQIQYVVADAGARIAVIESGFLGVFSRARERLPAIETVIVIDGEGGEATLAGLEGLDPGFDLSASVAEVGPDDRLTLIYTSGTTGPPKGVELTHRNLISLTSGVQGMIDLPERGMRVISWLPAAHIAERAAHYYVPVVRGCSVTICPDPRRIVEWLPKVRPTWFFAVPRIWEKLKAGLEANLASLPDDQRAPARQGLEAALEKVRLEQVGEPVPEELSAAVTAADAAMFAGLRRTLGLDEAVAVNVGAAPESLMTAHWMKIRVGGRHGLSAACHGLVSGPHGVPARILGPWPRSGRYSSGPCRSAGARRSSCRR